MLRRSGRLPRTFPDVLGSLFALLLACLVLSFFAASAQGQTPAITGITGESVYETAGGNITIGFEFVPQKSIIVTHVGVYDHGQDGLLESHEVGIWERDAETSGRLGKLGVVSPTAQREGKFRYVPITPVLLAAGKSYVIGAAWTLGKDPYVWNHTTLTADPEITYVKNRYAYTSGNILSYPGSSRTNEKGYFGPNFKFVLASQEVLETFTGSFNSQIPWQFTVPVHPQGSGDKILIDTQSPADLSFGANTWNVRLSSLPGTTEDSYDGLFGNDKNFRNLLNFEIGAVPADWYAETAVSPDLSKLTTYEELLKEPQAGLAVFDTHNYGVWINLTNDARRQEAEGSQQGRRSVILVGVQTTPSDSGIGDSYRALYLPFTPQPDAAFVRFRLEGRGTAGAKPGFLSSGVPGYYLYTDYGDGGALRQIGQPNGQTTGPTFFQGDTRLGPNRCYDVLNALAPGFRVGLNTDKWRTQLQLTARFDSFSTNLLPTLQPMTRGRIALQGLAATAASRPVHFYFRYTESVLGDFEITKMVGPGASLQDFSFPLRAGQYELRVSSPSYLSIRTQVTVTSSGSVTIPDITLLGGDVNLDGKVNLSDLVQLRSNYGKAGTNLNGDMNYDNKVNLTDLVLLRSNYGKNGQ